MRFLNNKAHESNKHPVGHPARKEHDFTEGEKEHLALLRSKLEMELANEARESNEKLSGRVWWLNLVLGALTILTGIVALCFAYFELYQ